MSDEKKECRICFDEGTDDDPLISPCNCKGTSAYVHKSCLSNWRNFNRDREAWNICMECHAEYIISRKYPTEKFFYDTNYKLPLLYFLQSVIGFCGALLIWCIEYNTNHLAVKILNFDKPKLNKIIIHDLTNNELIPQVFYYNFTFFIISILFHIRFYYNYYNKIKRKKIYWNQIKLMFCYNLILNLNFIYLYYFFVWNNLEILFYNFSSVLTFLTPYSQYKLLKYHNYILKKMNVENEEEVLSFTHNPLNQENEVELINVILD